MAEGRNANQINHLMEAIEEIRDRHALLSKFEDPTFIKYKGEMDRATEERRQQLRKYRQNELDGARRLYDGSLYQIAMDHERSLLNLEESMTEYVRCKYELIKKTFPKAARYFSTYVTKCPFMDALAGGKLREEDMSIELSTEPLVSQNEFEEALKDAQSRQKKCVIEAGSRITYEGITFQCNAYATLINGKSNPINGTIEEIHEKFIIFRLNDSRSVKVPLQALVMGLCRLQK